MIIGWCHLFGDAARGRDGGRWNGRPPFGLALVIIRDSRVRDPGASDPNFMGMRVSRERQTVTVPFEASAAEAAVEVKSAQPPSERQKVLNGINLRVTRCETVSVLGLSVPVHKCPVETNDRVVIRPTSGSSVLRGMKLRSFRPSRLKRDLWKKVGILFQNACVV